MASALPSFPSTKETTNYARLCRLLVDVGSQILRDTFDNIHPPARLHVVLARHPEHATLQSLRKKKILNPTQWGKLYPTTLSAVSSASFDITLLMVLLRNIYGLHPPVTGWDNLPPSTDTSNEANIARVKYYRNTVYGHASQASVDDATFNTYWKDISTALVALGGAGYVAAINKLTNECMDPDTEEHYRELLKQWKKDEDSIKDKLEEIEELLEEWKEEKGNINVKLGEVEMNIRSDIEQLPGRILENFMEKFMAAQLERYSLSDKGIVCKTANTLDQVRRRCKMGHIWGTSAGILGGIFTIAGEITATAGAASPLLIAGICFGTTGASTNLIASFMEASENSGKFIEDEKTLKKTSCLTDVNNTLKLWVGWKEAAAMLLYICCLAVQTLGLSEFANEMALKAKSSLQTIKANASGVIIIGVSASLVFDVVHLFFTVRDLVRNRVSDAAQFDELDKLESSPENYVPVNRMR